MPLPCRKDIPISGKALQFLNVSLGLWVGSADEFEQFYALAVLI